MKQPTAPARATEDQDPRPPDIKVMRAAAAELLGENTPLPRYEDVQTLTLLYRGNLMLMIPEVENLTGRLPHDDTPAKVALAGIEEARLRLDEIPTATQKVGLVSEVKRAQRLARSVLALCDHYENLTGGLQT